MKYANVEISGAVSGSGIRIIGILREWDAIHTKSIQKSVNGI